MPRVKRKERPPRNDAKGVLLTLEGEAIIERASSRSVSRHFALSASGAEERVAKMNMTEWLLQRCIYGKVANSSVIIARHGRGSELRKPKQYSVRERGCKKKRIRKAAAAGARFKIALRKHA